MPQRTFRVFLSNNTDHCLVRRSHDLDHGDWTPGGWEPPLHIPPRSERAWQSESAGIATGTEGSVEYRPLQTPGQLLGGGVPDPCSTPELGDRISITWNNPFLGRTSAGGSVSVGGNFDETTFDVMPAAFDNAGAAYEQDLFSLAAQAPFAPFIIFGTLGIVEHAVQHFVFRVRRSVRQSLALGYPPAGGLARVCGRTGVRSVRTALRIR